MEISHVTALGQSRYFNFFNIRRKLWSRCVKIRLNKRIKTVCPVNPSYICTQLNAEVLLESRKQINFIFQFVYCSIFCIYWKCYHIDLKNKTGHKPDHYQIYLLQYYCLNTLMLLNHIHSQSKQGVMFPHNFMYNYYFILHCKCWLVNLEYFKFSKHFNKFTALNQMTLCFWEQLHILFI